VQVPGAFGVDPSAQAAVLVDALSPSLEVRGVAFVRAQSSRSSPGLAVRDCSNNLASASGSAVAASVIAATCWADSSPRRAAAAVAGKSSSRRAACRISLAWPTVVPVVRAS
jgi:hypothetical protein